MACAANERTSLYACYLSVKEKIIRDERDHTFLSFAIALQYEHNQRDVLLRQLIVFVLQRRKDDPQALETFEYIRWV